MLEILLYRNPIVNTMSNNLLVLLDDLETHREHTVIGVSTDGACNMILVTDLNVHFFYTRSHLGHPEMVTQHFQPIFELFKIG